MNVPAVDLHSCALTSAKYADSITTKTTHEILVQLQHETCEPTVSHGQCSSNVTAMSTWLTAEMAAAAAAGHCPLVSADHCPVNQTAGLPGP